ncbi:DUF6350 family protein [Streptomyces sp. RFCAC02]|uniref:cell division protein PerM n=1 Tax=Streptomyces sp. RFCAC02 TaxID=2499143 RepID=UPI0010200E8D|nr:DUF6350 family protein [Streptomyces sp. RFCAC02]
MRHVTRPSGPPRPVPRLVPAGRVRARWLFEGLLAAGLGLGVPAALVLLLWTLSPYPDDGAGSALRVAADLWLLGHGTDLVRTGTLDGGPAPVGLTPLLLAAAPALLLLRAVRVSLLPYRDAPGWDADPADGPRAALWVSAGYLLAGTVVVVFARGGELAAEPLSAAVHLPLFAVTVTLAGACAVCGSLPSAAVTRWIGGLWWQRTGAAARAAGAGLAAYCGAGALLVGCGLAVRAGAAQDAFAHLATDWSGRLSVLLLASALAPNAAVWGAAYGLGPGFTAGAGSAVGPLAVRDVPRLPDFPLLAALPDGTPGHPALWVLPAVVPAAGAVVTAWFVARSRTAADEGAGATALLGLGTACGTGAGLGVLAAWAGGPLGTDALASFGPSPWLTGLAAAAWTAVTVPPLALLLRAARRSGLDARIVRLFRRPPEAPDAREWHLTNARLLRWAALRKTSGALVPEMQEPPESRQPRRITRPGED